MNTSKKIIFFGTEDFSLISLRALVEAGLPVAAVVTKPDMRKGRGQKFVQPAVKLYAEKYNIPVWQPSKLTEITSDIQALDHPIGVLVSFGRIIPQSIIDLFDPGIINVHPSLLPKYRGPSPIESAIANGDQETGVTLMRLSAAMDAGPLYAYTPLELTGRETRPELYETLGLIGAQMLVQLIMTLIDGANLQPMPQDESQATYCKLLSKSDGILDPSSLTAAEAERRIRAYIGFPKSKYTINNQQIIITQSHVVTTKNTPLDIECQDGVFLSIDELIAPSGRTMLGADFIRGYLPH